MPRREPIPQEFDDDHLTAIDRQESLKPMVSTTHLGLQVCPCNVNFKKFTFAAQQGVIFGTTTGRAIEMAKEAGLSLTVLLP